MKPYLLIHDTSGAGFLTAAVYARLQSRRGIQVQQVTEATRDADTFWREVAPKLTLDTYSKVVLCCVTFDPKFRDDCLKQLDRFRTETGCKPQVLSHRWPDGYQSAPDIELLVPPFALLEEHADHLQPAERELLRLSLIISRQADPSFVRPADITLAERLSQMIGTDADVVWNNLWGDDLEPFLAELRNAPDRRSPPAESFGILDSRGQGYALYLLGPGVRNYPEKAIEALLRHDAQPASETVVGIGIAQDELTGPRVHVVRLWTTNLPSIEFLLERYATQYCLPEAVTWEGPQDAKTFRFRRNGLEENRLPFLKQNLITFAGAVYHLSAGERRPFAGLSTAIHGAAVEALEKLDVARQHTGMLQFDPERLRCLLDRGNRVDGTRETLVLRLNALSAEAAAFLFQNESFNLIKLERLLEGVLIGMGQQRSRWLNSFRVPKRLRVDVTMSSNVIAALGDRLSSLDDVTLVQLDQAVRSGILYAEAPIVTAFEKYVPSGQANLILFCGSETIGPSVPYALAAACLADRLQQEKQADVDVLDLFSGSGLTAHLISQKAQRSRVYCVDLATSASDVGVKIMPKVTWLRTDVRQILATKRPLLGVDFDLIALDPPHGMFFELLFELQGEKWTLLDRVRELAPWLVVYQGHATQRGRADALRAALSSRFDNIRLWHIGPEIVTIAGPQNWRTASFDEIVGRAETEVTMECATYRWSFVSEVASSGNGGLAGRPS